MRGAAEDHHSTRRVAKTQGVLVLAYAARVLVAYGTTSVLGRTLDARDFGFYTLVGTIFFLAHLLLDLGTGSIAAREISKDPSKERPLLEALVTARLLLALLLALLVFLFAQTEDDPHRTRALMGAGLALFALAPGATSVLFIVRQAQGAPAAFGVINHLLGFIGVVGLAAIDADPIYFAWLIIGREVLGGITIALLARKRIGFSPRLGLRGRGFAKFLRSAFVQGLAVLLHAAYFHIDVFIVREMLAEEDLGAYAAAYRPITPLLMVPAILMTPLLPALSSVHGRDESDFNLRTRQFFDLLLGVGAIAAVSGVALSPDLLRILYGGAFQSAPLDSTEAFQWMSAALGMVFAAGPLSTALVAAGRERVLVKIGIAALAMNVIGNLWLLPIGGFTAAATVTAATEGLVLLLMFLAVRVHLGVQIPIRNVLRSLIPAALVACILALVPFHGPIRVGFAVIVSGLGLALLLRLQGRSLRRRRSKGAASAEA